MIEIEKARKNLDKLVEKWGRFNFNLEALEKNYLESSEWQKQLLIDEKDVTEVTESIRSVKEKIANIKLVLPDLERQIADAKEELQRLEQEQKIQATWAEDTQLHAEAMKIVCILLDAMETVGISASKLEGMYVKHVQNVGDLERVKAGRPPLNWGGINNVVGRLAGITNLGKHAKYLRTVSGISNEKPPSRGLKEKILAKIGS